MNAIEPRGIFSHIAGLAAALRSNDQQAITAVAEGLKADYDRVVRIRGETGARVQEIEARQQRLEDQNVATKALQSSLEDVDFPDAIARFGQFLLQKGEWEGRQLVPAAWIAEATRSHIDNSPNEKIDWEQGYGYQFWRCRHNCYRGDGAFGQYCIVMPEQDAVLAITSGVPDMQAVLDLVWKHLLPAMGPQALQADADANAKLAARLGNLAIPPQAGNASARIAKKVSGSTYDFETNDQHIGDVALTFGDDGATLSIKQGRRRNVIRVGHGTWVEGTAHFIDMRSDKICASGAWKNPSTYVVALCYPETPFITTATFKFDGDQVEFTNRINVGFGPTAWPTLIGRRA